jgi:hypothetical protein
MEASTTPTLSRIVIVASSMMHRHFSSHIKMVVGKKCNPNPNPNRKLTEMSRTGVVEFLATHEN